jgi:anti-anti-sigma factor
MTSADIKTEYNAETRVLTVILSGELDHHSAYPLREEADRELAIRRPKTLVLDVTGIAFMDSAGLGYILGRYGKAQALGTATEVCGASEQIWRILKLAGADKLIKVTKRQ